MKESGFGERINNKMCRNEKQMNQFYTLYLRDKNGL